MWEATPNEEDLTLDHFIFLSFFFYIRAFATISPVRLIRYGTDN